METPRATRSAYHVHAEIPDLNTLDADDPRAVAHAGAQAFEDALLQFIGFAERLEAHVRNAELTRAIDALEPGEMPIQAASALEQADSQTALATRVSGAIGTSWELARELRERIEQE